MSDYPDSGDEQVDRHLTVLCSTCGEEFVSDGHGGWQHLCAINGPRVYAEIGGPLISAPMIGDDGLEILTISEEAVIAPFKHIRCNGPDCQEETLTLSPAAGWRTVTGPYHLADYEVYNLCSLRCLANWLAGELAKEEG